MKSPFVRTPKYHIVRAVDQWKDKEYAARPSETVILECLLALYCLLGLILAVMFGQYGAVPFHTMFVFGFGTVAFFTLKHHFVKTGIAVTPAH